MHLQSPPKSIRYSSLCLRYSFRWRGHVVQLSLDKPLVEAEKRKCMCNGVDQTENEKVPLSWAIKNVIEGFVLAGSSVSVDNVVLQTRQAG